MHRDDFWCQKSDCLAVEQRGNAHKFGQRWLGPYPFDSIYYKSIWYILRSATFAISSCTTCVFEMHAPLTLLEHPWAKSVMKEATWAKQVENGGDESQPLANLFLFLKRTCRSGDGALIQQELVKRTLRCFRAALTVYSELHELWTKVWPGPTWFIVIVSAWVSLETSPKSPTKRMYPLTSNGAVKSQQQH